MKKPLLILTGPTAVGKTKLSLDLAKRLNGSVISADSMQVYKYMDIGSAKIRPEQMQGIRHYLIDKLLPEEEFNVFRFQVMAQMALEEIYREGKLPIVVGGTGFYIQALLKDVDFSKDSGQSPVRRQLESLAKEGGASVLYDRLALADPVSAGAIHPNNVKRVIRALEYFYETGMPISSHNAAEREKMPVYQAAYFVLNDDRAKLYKKIGQRVDLMMEEGLLEEVRALKDRGCDRTMVSMQGLGYKELLAYLDGECTLEEAVDAIKRDTRHLAKRQMTWFKREQDVIWLNKPDFSYDDARILDAITDIWKLKQKEEEDV